MQCLVKKKLIDKVATTVQLHLSSINQYDNNSILLSLYQESGMGWSKREAFNEIINPFK